MNYSEKKTQENQHAFVGKIDKVDAVKVFHETTGDHWIPILNTFNPLGMMADAYAKTLAYKIETKRLDVELVRVREQATIVHHLIDASLDLKITELEHRRMALSGFYHTVNAELEWLHIERALVLEMAKAAQQKAFTEGLSLAERLLYQEMCIVIISQLPIFGDKANESLQKLVQALPPVTLSSKLWEGL